MKVRLGPDELSNGHVQISLHCRQTKPPVQLVCKSVTKSLFRPRVLPGFSIIIGSNWLLYMAVHSCAQHNWTSGSHGAIVTLSMKTRYST